MDNNIEDFKINGYYMTGSLSSFDNSADIVSFEAGSLVWPSNFGDFGASVRPVVAQH